MTQVEADERRPREIPDDRADRRGGGPRQPREAAPAQIAGRDRGRRDARGRADGVGVATGARRRIGTALRLAGLQAAVLAAVLGIVVVALVHQVSTSYRSIAASTLTAQLRSYVASADHGGVDSAATLFTFSHRYLQTHSLPAGQQLVFGIPGEGVVGTVGTRAVLTDQTVTTWLRDAPKRSRLEVARVGGRDTELLAAPIDVGGRTLGTFVATTSLATLDAQRSRAVELALAEAAIALVAGALSAYLLLRRLLRTVGRITSTAEEIHRGDLEKRLGDPGTRDEVSHLAGTFDAMLDRLSGVMATQRRLLSDVSHQLRTPLTVARGHLEVLTRSGCDDAAATTDTVRLVLDELGHMTTLVDSLLLLGRAIEPDFLQVEPIDLRAFLADLYEAVTVVAEREWGMSPVPDLVVHADAAKLRGALLNVVDNAIKATGPHDAVALSAELAPDGGSVLLAVDDAGPGIPPGQRGAVLERFARLPGQQAPGTGLGLAIVDAVARAHGGSVEIATSALGGARVGVRLPAGPVFAPEEGPS